MQPIVNDFFCGCGGMGVGFLNAGYKIAGAWDFDKYAVQSYDHNVGHHVKQADIKEMTWQDVPFAHVWAFGFPCQDLSVAGKQAGLLLKFLDKKTIQSQKANPNGIRTPAGVSYGALGAGSLRLSGL